jgi:solute carrier family 40 (iron-regulated transporter), member 1
MNDGVQTSVVETLPDNTVLNTPAADSPTAETSQGTHGSYKWSLAQFYTNHFLFTWNDRVWEFASVILLISAYPQTLLPSSLFGLLTTASAILFGPAIGRSLDSTARLKSVRSAIFCQRISVSAGCICLWAMIVQTLTIRGKHGLFAVVILFGCVAKLAFVGKTACIERDWVFLSNG